MLETNIVYIVKIIPTKESKTTYILGVYSSRELALKDAELEIRQPDASWWTKYAIVEMPLTEE